MTTDPRLQMEVIRKLDQLVVLFKLANRGAIEEAWNRINSDEISRSLMDLSDGALDSGELQKRVSDATGKSTRTVQARIGDLVRQGVLVSERRGNRLYYRKTDLFE